MEDSVETKDSGISPGVVFLIALFSIGGLLFVSWIGAKGSITGEVISAPYSSCCTVAPWGTSQAGYRDGTGITFSSICYSDELPSKCCLRSGKNKFMSPVKLLGSNWGTCLPAGPQVSYPYGQFSSNQYNICCTIKKWGGAPTGIIQGEGETTTESCSAQETPFECCARAGADRTSSSVRVAGVRTGACSPPPVNYPAFVPQGGYPICCTYQSWLQSPSGYSQGTAKSSTQYCDQLDTPAQCCIRALGTPVKFLGARAGTCAVAVPEQSYPTWIR